MAWEEQILLALQAGRNDFATFFMQLFSTSCELGAVWILITFAMLLGRKTRKTGVTCVAAMVFGLCVANGILKPVIARLRPYDVLDSLEAVKGWLVAMPHDYSFPSGHSVNSFATSWVILRCEKKKLGIPALILAALISFSRLYVGVHYPTDVLAGAVIGIACAEVMKAVVNRFYPEQKRYAHKKL